MADEGLTLSIFVRPWSFSDEAQFGIERTDAEDRLGTRRRQVRTALASGHALPQQLDLLTSLFDGQPFRGNCHLTQIEWQTYLYGLSNRSGHLPRWVRSSHEGQSETRRSWYESDPGGPQTLCVFPDLMR